MWKVILTLALTTVLAIPALATAEDPSLARPDDDGADEVRAAMFALPEDYREPLVLQVLLGYSTDEIARHLGLSNGAVLTRLCRARQKLRRQLGLGPTGEAE